MDVIILAGGFGTRLSEYTHSIPKPMVEIGNKPILLHIIDLYARYGQNKFFIAMGYKSEEIIKFFIGNEGYEKTKGDDLIDIKKFNDLFFKQGLDIILVYTGENTMTGGRVKRVQKYLSTDKFMVTYGDGIADINIKNLIYFHNENKKIGTVTAVRPPARFGELEIDGHSVLSFKEKPQLQKGWINGGFFIFEKIFFDFIEGDSIMLEREPLESLTSKENLVAFKHEGFWQCMDTKRDKDLLEQMWNSEKTPWIR